MSEGLVLLGVIVSKDYNENDSKYLVHWASELSQRTRLIPEGQYLFKLRSFVSDE